MGLKSGSRDAGLDETDDEEDRPTEQEASPVDDPSNREADSEKQVGVDGDSTDSEAMAAGMSRRSSKETSTETTNDSTEEESRPTIDSIPYKLRRNKVNEGREQVPYFLREEIIEAEDELQNTLEWLLDENVYKSDYREAAMVVAQRNPELVADVLREWGYDLETR